MKWIRNIWILLFLFGLVAGINALPLSAVAAEDVEAKDQSGETSIQDIERSRARLRKKLKKRQADLILAVDRLGAEQDSLKKLSEKRNALKQEVADSLRSKKELDVIITGHARNFLAQAERSPFSAEKPQRLEKLRTYIDRDHVFSMNDLRTLLDLFFEDMEAAGQKIIYTGTVLDRGGNEVEGEVVRLGHIAAMHRTSGKTGFLSLSPSSGRLVMSAEPSFLVRRNLNNYIDGDTDHVYADISNGAAIQQLAHKDTFADQLRSGGVLVIPILLVGLVALGLTIERVIFLAKVRHNTDELMTRVTELVAQGDFDAALKITAPHRNRPTGRVLMAGLRHRGETREIIESSLSEAILRETPRLERFLNALKVAAAVAPLLGLLGTVTGMINTFQVITTHGTGDPRLMAGGISEAMVTTQVGLAVAIPVMMVAAFLGGRAHKLSQDMEEKGLALMGALLKLKQNNGSLV